MAWEEIVREPLYLNTVISIHFIPLELAASLNRTAVRRSAIFGNFKKSSITRGLAAERVEIASPKPHTERLSRGKVKFGREFAGLGNEGNHAVPNRGASPSRRAALRVREGAHAESSHRPPRRTKTGRPAALPMKAGPPSTILSAALVAHSAKYSPSLAWLAIFSRTCSTVVTMV